MITQIPPHVRRHGRSPHIRIEVSDGASIPDPSDKRLVTAWSIAFAGAVGMLVYLCSTQPDPYWLVLQFVSAGIVVTFQVTVSAITLAIPIGLLTGVGRLSRHRAINLVASPM